MAKYDIVITGMPFMISDHARSIEELKKLPLETQALLLLKRLHQLYWKNKAAPTRFNKGNIVNRYTYSDPEGLASGFSGNEVTEVIDHLLGEPWHYLEQHFYITSPIADGWFEITRQGAERAKEDVDSRTPDRTVIAALAFLHSDLQSSSHYFYEGKPKDAVIAAFTRVENRLNEIRDASGNAEAAKFDGVVLPRKLFDTGVFQFPYPKLSSGNATRQAAYMESIKNFLSSGIGWFRNSFQHESHNLPELDDAGALELLFIASYMLRLIDHAQNPV